MRKHRFSSVLIAHCSSLIISCGGCAYQAAVHSVVPHALPQANGSYYHVKPGETLWRIAQDFGVDVRTLARVNRVADPTILKTGQTLFIPLPPESRRFLWPVRGESSRAHGHAWSAADPGLDIRAPEGSFVRASRTGRVAVAAQKLAHLGTTVVLDHGDGYVSMYSGLEQLLVNPGADVRQGVPLGRLGRASLYFEIRYHTTPRDPLVLLP